ncbi:MAG: FadR/GntR family transcriptional regulator [Actinomycetota bacterium]
MSGQPLERFIKSSPPPALEVARSLLDYVLRSGEVSVGDKLPPERQFAEAFGVGRSAVREALKSLSLLGLVEIRQGDGTYVASSSSDLLPRVIEWGLLLGERRTMETVEARQHIEVLIAGLAATRRDDPSVERLGGHLATMERSIDQPEALVAADVAFHMEVAHAAGNRVMTNILSSLQSLLHVWIGRVIAEDPGNAELTVQEHRAIFRAIEAGDEARARDAMAAHLSRARRRLEVSLEDNPSDDRGEGSDASGGSTGPDLA